MRCQTTMRMNYRDSGTLEAAACRRWIQRRIFIAKIPSHRRLSCLDINTDTLALLHCPARPYQDFRFDLLSPCIAFVLIHYPTLDLAQSLHRLPSRDAIQERRRSHFQYQGSTTSRIPIHQVLALALNPGRPSDGHQCLNSQTNFSRKISRPRQGWEHASRFLISLRWGPVEDLSWYTAPLRHLWAFLEIRNMHWSTGRCALLLSLPITRTW